MSLLVCFVYNDFIPSLISSPDRRFFFFFFFTREDEQAAHAHKRPGQTTQVQSSP
jgi:hypothetical protein